MLFLGNVSTLWDILLEKCAEPLWVLYCLWQPCTNGSRTAPIARHLCLGNLIFCLVCLYTPKFREFSLGIFFVSRLNCGVPKHAELLELFQAQKRALPVPGLHGRATEKVLLLPGLQIFSPSKQKQRCPARLLVTFLFLLAWTHSDVLHLQGEEHLH